MKPIKLIILLVAIAGIVVGLTAFFYTFLKVYEVKEIPLSLKVGDRVGLSASPSLYLGTAPPNGAIEKKFYVENKYDRAMKVYVNVDPTGFMNWIRIEDNPFILKVGEGKNVTLTAHIPENAIRGTYSNKLKILFKKP